MRFFTFIATLHFSKFSKTFGILKLDCQMTFLSYCMLSLSIDIDQYRSILININQSVSINVDQYRSILINIDQSIMHYLCTQSPVRGRCFHLATDCAYVAVSFQSLRHLNLRTGTKLVRARSYAQCCYCVRTACTVYRSWSSCNFTQSFF